MRIPKRKTCFCSELVKPVHAVEKLPREVKKLSVAFFLVTAMSQLLLQGSSFMLDNYTLQRELGNEKLAYCFLVLFVSKQVLFRAIFSTTDLLSSLKEKKLSLDAGYKVMGITAAVKGKIKTDKDSIMSQSEICETLNSFISGHRECLYKGISLTTSYCIFFGTIIELFRRLNSRNASSVMIPIIVVVFILIVALALFKFNLFQKHFAEMREYRLKISASKNDCINSNFFSERHRNFIVSNHAKILDDLSKKQVKNRLCDNSLGILSAAIDFIAVVVVINDLIGDHGLCNSPIDVIGIVSILGSIISNLSLQVDKTLHFFSDISAYQKYMQDFSKILEVYDRLNSKEIILPNETLEIFPFEFSFKNFTLQNKDIITLQRDKFYLLRGDSGAGKSTFFRILSGELGNRPKISTTWFFSGDHLGCQNILDELTLGKPVDEERMLHILQGVCIYDDLLMKANGRDIFTYLSSAKGGFSDGMYDRLLLARTLYNLDDSDLVLLDEPIGRIDLQRGRKIIEFILQELKGKNKIVCVTSHQFQHIIDLFDEILVVEKAGHISEIQQKKVS